MIYLVCFETLRGIQGHKHVDIEKWASADDTQYAVDMIAKFYNLDPVEIVIKSVLKLPDQQARKRVNPLTSN